MFGKWYWCASTASHCALCVQIINQVNPSCHKQDPSLNVLDYAQGFMLHNAALQVKNPLTNSAPKGFNWKLKLYHLGSRLIVRKS